MATERLSDEQIAGLERLEREATEWHGDKWIACEPPDPDGRGEPWLSTPEDPETGSASIVAVDMSEANAKLAAAMRSALPSLLAEVRAARLREAAASHAADDHATTKGANRE